MVGMEVRIDHVEDLHAHRFRCREIRLNVADRIDDGAGGLAAAPKKIGGRHGLGMQELA